MTCQHPRQPGPRQLQVDLPTSISYALLLEAVLTNLALGDIP